MDFLSVSGKAGKKIAAQLINYKLGKKPRKQIKRKRTLKKVLKV